MLSQTSFYVEPCLVGVPTPFSWIFLFLDRPLFDSFSFIWIALIEFTFP